MSDYTLKIHTIDGVSLVSFPYYGIYVTNLKVDHDEVIYPHHIRRKGGKIVLDASGKPIQDAIYHPMAAFADTFEEWIRDVARSGRANTMGLDSPEIYVYVTPRNFGCGSELLAFVCLNYHGLIIDDIALKKDSSGNMFLTMPHRSITGPDGARHPVDIVEISDPHEYDRIMEMVLEKYQLA